MPTDVPTDHTGGGVTPLSYTPGAWWKHYETDRTFSIESAYGNVATVTAENCDIDAQVRADATLIAAASLLYEFVRDQAAGGNAAALNLLTRIHKQVNKNGCDSTDSDFPHRQDASRP